MISAEDIEKVRLTISGSGWRDVMMPLYARRAQDALKALSLSPSERKVSGSQFKDFEDESLRGVIREAEWMMSVWHNEVAMYDANRRRDELDRQPEGQVPTVPTTANP